MELIEKPLSFGGILDLTFSTVKNYFSRLFLIVLILLGPCYLLVLLAMVTGGTPLAIDPSTTFSSILENIGGTSPNQLAGFGGLQYALYFLGLFASVFFSIPVAYASLIIAAGKIRQNETPVIGPIIRQALSRYGALLGGSIVYGLISIGVIYGMIIIFIIFIGVSFGSAFLTDTGLSGLTAISGFGLKMTVLIVLGLASFCGMTYLLVRWSYFFPAVVFEKVAPGIGKSWRLTRHNFWRLIGIYIVIGIIATVISLACSALTMTLFGNSVLTTLISYLVSMILSLFSVTAYAVTYFDLRIRNEAADLKEIVSSYDSELPPNNPDSHPDDLKDS